MTSGMAPPVQRALAAERALPAGTRLEEYEIECVLAQSSTAVVYQAYDRVLKLHVAMQEFFPDALALRSAETELLLRDGAYAGSFERGRQAFVDEARMLAHCEHPSLPHILRILQHHGTVYRVMRCCHGPTLCEFRQALCETPSAASVRSLLDSLLGALAELHRQGRVHAAVSPANILMLADGRPMLLDSGAVHAALISDRTRGVMAALEPGFAPLEQCEPSPERPLGPWTDLYALAATLHFFIGGGLPVPPAGEVPRRFEPFGLLWQRLHADAPGWPQQAAWLGALDACLADSAQDRPQSVAQLRAVLDGQWASRLPSLAAPSPWSAVSRDSAEVAGHRALARMAAQAEDFSGLEQTLPFIAARAHEVVASSYPPVMTADPAWRAWARHHRRRWAGGAAALLLLLMVGVAAGEWMRSQGRSAAATAAGPAGGVAHALTQPADVPDAAAAIDYPPPGAGRPEADAGVAGPEPGASSAATPAPAPAASVARAPDNPRQLCGTRSGYVLYQCMQTQCAKRGWVNHAQCQRLRRDQSLG